jgi:hypothetical protein
VGEGKSGTRRRRGWGGSVEMGGGAAGAGRNRGSPLARSLAVLLGVGVPHSLVTHGGRVCAAGWGGGEGGWMARFNHRALLVALQMIGGQIDFRARSGGRAVLLNQSAAPSIPTGQAAGGAGGLAGGLQGRRTFKRKGGGRCRRWPRSLQRFAL